MNVSFISLGCDKNRVNTEQMMAMCLQAGMTVQEDVNGSDVVVINTCGFIDSAKTEAIETILSAAEPALPGRNDDGAAGDRRHDGHRRLR